MVDDWIESGEYKKESIKKSSVVTLPEEDENFEIEEEETLGKAVITIYGNKGEGKTTLALGIDGKIVALSFDNKTALIKYNMYNGDKRIKVFNAVKYFSEDPNEYTTSAKKTYKYVIAILKKVKEIKPDWIIIDGTEIMMRIAEQVMREMNNLSPFQGVVNRNIWKYRRLVIRNIHRKALDAAQKGVIYTTYTTKDEIVEEGTIVSKKDVPQYYDILLWETDVVIKAYSEFNEDNDKRFYARIDSSKLKEFETGKIYDVTNKTLKDIIKEVSK